jgi:hypothetical protein
MKIYFNHLPCISIPKLIFINYYLNAEKMSTRHCSCCLQAGHNIKRCTDADAQSIMNQIMNSNAATAINLVDTISNNHVSFVLVRGFNLSVRANRQALRNSVLQLYNRRNSLPAAHSLITPQVIIPPQVVTPPQVIAPYSLNAYCFYSNQSLVHMYYNSNPSSLNLLAYHKVIAYRCLLTLEHRGRTQRELSYDMFIHQRMTICSSLIASSEYDMVYYYLELNFVLTQRELTHIVYMIRMLDYYRLMTNRDTFRGILEEPIAFCRQGAVVPVADKMKLLNIDVAICCAPCNKVETCGICFDDLESKKIMETGCGHVYCGTCITGVAHQRGIKTFIPCPGCRADIRELKVYDADERNVILDGLKPIPIHPVTHQPQPL